MKTNNLFLVNSGSHIQFIFIALLLFIPTTKLWAKNQKQILVIENVYIHTDKSIYVQGEDLWFKAYILNSESHIPSNISKLLFINIIDEASKPIFTSSYPIINGLANGDFQLPENLKNGNYQIIAYTENQKQLSSTYWFRANIEINSRPVNLWDIIYQHDSLALVNSNLEGDIFCVSQDGSPIADAKLKITLSSSETELHTKSVNTDSTGKYHLTWAIPEQYANEAVSLTLHAEFLNETKVISLNIPLGKSGLDLRFFPEGGNFVEGIENNIAFNATDNFGNPINIEGILTNQNGDPLNDIKSEQDGMGVFNIKPLNNETYFVSVKKPILKNAVYQLPKATQSGYVLSVDSCIKDQLTLVLNMTDDLKGKEVELTLSNGITTETLFNAILKKKTQIHLSTKEYPIGISILTLCSNGLPVAERLVFLNKHKKINLSVKANKEFYAPREKVELTIYATDFNGKPSSANLSLAVADENRIDNQQGLLANMLLSSQLNHTPKNVSTYLNDSPEADKLLNLLLMVQGWRKIELIAEYTRITQTIQNDDGIKGRVFLNKSKLAKNAQVQIVNTQTWQMISTQTNDQGCFIFPLNDYLEIADKTDLLISANIPNSNKKLRIELDKEISDSIFFDLKKERLLTQVYNLQNKLEQENNDVPNQKDIGFENKPTMYTNFDSVRFLLSEFEVKAKTITKERREALKRTNMDYAKKADDIQMVTTSTAVNSGATNPQLEMLGTLKQIYPFLFLQGGKIVSRGPSTLMAGRETGMIVVIDGLESTMSQAVELANQIQEIKISTGPAAGLKYGSDYLSGVVEITLKKSDDYLIADSNKGKDKNLSVIKGIRIARVFNTPNYDFKDVEHSNFDNRSTIYWNPDVNIDDQGNTKISFYNSDKRNKIKCVFMGVNKAGLLLNHQITYDVF